MITRVHDEFWESFFWIFLHLNNSHLKQIK